MWRPPGAIKIRLGRIRSPSAASLIVSEHERSSRLANTPVNWAIMCCTTRIGGMGAERSGRIWLSACGPPVEIPITRQVAPDAEVGVAAVGVAAALSGARSAGAGRGRVGEPGVIRVFPGRAIVTLLAELEDCVVRRSRRTRLCAAVRTLATSRSEVRASRQAGCARAWA